LFYTSGTTGAAKGVPLSHSNLVFQLDTLLGAGLVTGEDRVLLPLSLYHVYPFVMGTLTPLAAGLPIVMPHSLTGPQLVRAFREGEASLSIGVPGSTRLCIPGYRSGFGPELVSLARFSEVWST
jgi:long-chain acyl-CoA synthetase